MVQVTITIERNVLTGKFEIIVPPILCTPVYEIAEHNLAEDIQNIIVHNAQQAETLHPNIHCVDNRIKYEPKTFSNN